MCRIILFACFVSMKLHCLQGFKFDDDWTYSTSSQNNWPGQCKDGSNQSPIKIDPTEDDFEKKQMDPFIFVNYNQSSKSDPKLKNIGHTINVMFDFENTPMIKAGGLNSAYRLAEIHLHWSSGTSVGYEHEVTVNGANKGTAVMEIQLIHIHDSYEETDIMKALKKRNNKTDTLAILSVLVELQKSDNTKLDSLFNATQNVKAMNDTQEFKGIRLSDLLPRNTDGFYRYSGSLTYPNCTEAAIWTIFKDPLYITDDQRDKIEGVTSVQKNYRDLQPLGARKIMDVETGYRNFNAGYQALANSLIIGGMLFLTKFI